MLVQLQDVRKNYGDFQLDCSFHLKEGQITGLVGQNGAGKTTAFKMILGLVSPEGGNLQVLGQDMTEGENLEKSRVGAVLSDSGFGGHMTVKHGAAVLSSVYENFPKAFFLEKCRACGLPLNKKVKEFSTGMKAKLKVLIAVSHGAELLVLDEPTAGLDVMARDEIVDILREYMENEGRGILISSHISRDLESLCDDIYLIHKGRIIYHEDTDVILSDYGIIKVTEEQYRRLDQEYILAVKAENYGYSCLTKERRFYQENFPGIAVEKCGIDEIEIMLTGGEKR